MPETKISGSELPNPTIVKPISNGDKLKFLAIEAAPVTNLFAEKNNAIKLAIRVRELISIHLT
jgi:hypothetical protein